MALLQKRASWAMRMLLAATLVIELMPSAAWAEEDLEDLLVTSKASQEDLVDVQFNDPESEPATEEWDVLVGDQGALETVAEETENGSSAKGESESSVSSVLCEDEVELANDELNGSSSTSEVLALDSGRAARVSETASFEFSGLTYSFLDGVLTIEGDGAIPMYAFRTGGTNPYSGFKTDAEIQGIAREWVESGVRKIVIRGGVTTLNAGAFQDDGGDFAELVSVDMSASSIAKISSSAFRYCANLSDVQLPSTVTNIATTAFGGCNLPAVFALPPGVSTLVSTTFKDSRVKVVTHPDWTLITETVRNQLINAGLTLEDGDPAGPFGTVGLPYIDEPEPDDKEAIELPEKGGFTYKDAYFAWEVNGQVLFLKRLGDPANWTAAAPFGCSDAQAALLQVVTADNGAAITTIEFGDGISEIPNDFASEYLNIWRDTTPHTPSVKTVKLSTSVTKVGIRAFNSYMTALITVEIPVGSNLTTLENNAFAAPNIAKLNLSNTKITTLGGASAPVFTLPYNRIVFPSTLTTLKENAFSSTCMDLDGSTGVLDIPDSVKVVEAGAFAASASSLGDVDTITIPEGCDFSPAAFSGSIDALLVKRGSPYPTKDPAEVQVRGTWTKDTAFVQLTEGAKAKTLLYADYDLTDVVPADALSDKPVRTGDEVEELLASLGGEQSAGELGPALYSAYYRESTGADVDGLTLEDIILHRETIGHGKMLKVSDASGRVTAVDVTDLLNGSESLSIDTVMQGVDMAGATAGGFPFASWTWELLLDDGTSEVTGTPTVAQVLTGMFGVRAKWGGETTAPTTPTTPPHDADDADAAHRARCSRGAHDAAGAHDALGAPALHGKHRKRHGFDRRGDSVPRFARHRRAALGRRHGHDGDRFGHGHGGRDRSNVCRRHGRRGGRECRRGHGSLGRIVFQAAECGRFIGAGRYGRRCRRGGFPRRLRHRRYP